MTEKREGLDVKCPQCRKVYLETTDKYDPDVKANGAMVRLKNPWKKWNWSPFGDGVSEKLACKESRTHHNMYCPGCNAILCKDGQLLVVEKPVSEKTAIKQVEEPETISGTGIEQPKGIIEEIPPKSPEEIFDNLGQGKEDKEPEPPKVQIKTDDIYESEIPPETRNEKIFRLKKSKKPKMSNAAIGREVGLSGAMVGKILKKKREKK